jgi:hypothetical protein
MKMTSVLRNEKGIAMVYTATILAVIFGLVVVNLIGSRRHHSDMSARIRVAITGFNIMENFGLHLQRAYDLGQREPRPAPCPAGTAALDRGGNRFCMPDTNGSGSFDSTDLCVDGYCVNATLVAQNELGHEEIYFTAQVQSTWFERMVARIRELPWDQMNSTAHAQRVVHLPAPPGPAATNNAIGAVACPGPLCKVCGAAGGPPGDNIACVSIRVCPRTLGCPTANLFWFQRYGFRF